MDKLTPEQEAERLYPNDSDDSTERLCNAAARSAHITAARMYMGEAERLKALLKNTVTPNCECEACTKDWNEFKVKHKL